MRIYLQIKQRMQNIFRGKFLFHVNVKVGKTDSVKFLKIHRKTPVSESHFLIKLQASTSEHSYFKKSSFVI